MFRIYETSLLYAKHVAYIINRSTWLAEKFRIYVTFFVSYIRNKFRIYVTCYVYTKRFRPQVRSLIPVEQSRRAAEEFRAPPHHFSLAMI